MSSNAKRGRAIVMTVIAALAVNYAISYASGVPTLPSSPRPKFVSKSSGIPTLPSSPRPKADVVASGIPTLPSSPRP